MAGAKRTNAQIAGAQRAALATSRLGEEIAASRKRRRLTQVALAQRIGISRSRLAQIEAGGGAGAPPEVWFALAEALGRYLKFEFARDPQADLVDAGHLAMQELILKVAKLAGWQGGFELPTRPADPARSIDVPLVPPKTPTRDRRVLEHIRRPRLNSLLGGAARSSSQKMAAAGAAAIATGGDNGAYEVDLCWVIRDTKRNRELVARYAHIFGARLPVSPQGWVKALTERGAPMPRSTASSGATSAPRDCSPIGTRLFPSASIRVDGLRARE